VSRALRAAPTPFRMLLPNNPTKGARCRTRTIAPLSSSCASANLAIPRAVTGRNLEITTERFKVLEGGHAELRSRSFLVESGRTAMAAASPKRPVAGTSALAPAPQTDTHRRSLTSLARSWQSSPWAMAPKARTSQVPTSGIAGPFDEKAGASVFYVLPEGTDFRCAMRSESSAGNAAVWSDEVRSEP